MLIGCGPAGGPTAPAVIEQTAVPQETAVILPTLTPNPTPENNLSTDPISTPASTLTETAVANQPAHANTTETAVAPPPVSNAKSVPQFTTAPSNFNQSSPIQQIRFNETNSGIWQYPDNSFVHPIALAVHGQTAFLLDGGRVIDLDLSGEQLPTVILTFGDQVEGVPILEPVDLTISQNGLLVLDRAGDLYRLDLTTRQWTLVRYQRPSGDTSSHYYVAIAGDSSYDFPNHRYYLEVDYNYVVWEGADVRERLWNLPAGFGVDVAARDGRSFILMHHPQEQTNSLRQYFNTGLIFAFKPTLDIVQPRELLVTETAVYLLDQAGARLTELDIETGKVLLGYQLPPESSTFWTDGEQLIVAGRDRLYFYGQPEKAAFIAGEIGLIQPLPHDTAVLANLPQLIVPIPHTNLPQREFQMPGAPRHYRLGVHEGIDFYWRRGTPIRTVADGVVVRMVDEYERPSQQEIDEWRETTARLSLTPAAALDFYRGQQIWIQHQNGLITRYAHLSEFAPDIEEGMTVTAGQLIGAVGNTGSPASVNSDHSDAHLHFELWLNDEHFVGRYLRPIETREWIKILFDP